MKKINGYKSLDGEIHKTFEEFEKANKNYNMSFKNKFDENQKRLLENKNKKNANTNNDIRKHNTDFFK